MGRDWVNPSSAMLAPTTTGPMTGTKSSRAAPRAIAHGNGSPTTAANKPGDQPRPRRDDDGAGEVAAYLLEDAAAQLPHPQTAGRRREPVSAGLHLGIAGEEEQRQHQYHQRVGDGTGHGHTDRDDAARCSAADALHELRTLQRAEQVELDVQIIDDEVALEVDDQVRDGGDEGGDLPDHRRHFAYSAPPSTASSERKIGATAPPAQPAAVSHPTDGSSPTASNAATAITIKVPRIPSNHRYTT